MYMLSLYRRHSPKCKYQSMSEKRCHCPLWVVGTIDGKPLRQSLKTRVWEVGQRKVRDWEAAGRRGTGADRKIQPAEGGDDGTIRLSGAAVGQRGRSRAIP